LPVGSIDEGAALGARAGGGLDEAIQRQMRPGAMKSPPARGFSRLAAVCVHR
jgi:hypothetical protein